MPEPTVDETIEILKGLQEWYELCHKLCYTDEALVAAAAELSYQYISDRFLPDKAIDLTDEAGSQVRLLHHAARDVSVSPPTVTEVDIHPTHCIILDWHS